MLLNKDFDQIDLTTNNELWVEDGDHCHDVVATKRIGLREKRFGEWALKPWRFYENGNRFVSKRDKHAEEILRPD